MNHILAAGGMESLISIGMIVVLLAVFYFVGIRPQKKQEKETKAMRDALTVGDEITTIGGIIGKVVRITDETVIIETSRDRTRLNVHKWAIRNVDVHAEDAQD